MMESYKDTSTNTKGGSYYNNHHNNNHKNKRNNRSNNKNANNGNNTNNTNTTTEYQNSGTNNNQRGGNKFANKTNTFLNNNKNNNQGGGGKQRRGSSNNYNGGHNTVGGSTLNTSKSCNNGFIRHESFDDRLSKSFSKDKQSPNNSFVDYQLPTSYSFDNLNKQVRTPSKQSGGGGSGGPQVNPYSFLSSNVDPYAKLSPLSNKENDQPPVNLLSVNEQANKSTTPKGHEVNDESISCYSTPLSQVDNENSTTGNNITLNSSGNTTLSSGETYKTSSQQYLSPPENKFNINDISEDSTTMSANHQDILNLINKDMLSPDSRSYNDEALVTASEGEGSFGQEATVNVEKTIISTSFDKAALDNLLSNLDQQNQSGQVDLNDLNVQVASESSIKEAEEEEETKTNLEISDLVSKIVQEAVVKAKEMAEKEEEEEAVAAADEKKNESFELIEKQELTDEDLKQIELEEKRPIELKEVKLTEQNDTTVATVAVTPAASPDKINKSVTFSPTRTEISQSVGYDGTEAIDQIKSSPRTNGVNESTMSLNSAGGKQGKQKAAAASDVDCFSCSIL